MLYFAKIHTIIYYVVYLIYFHKGKEVHKWVSILLWKHFFQEYIGMITPLKRHQFVLAQFNYNRQIEIGASQQPESEYAFFRLMTFMLMPFFILLYILIYFDE